MSHPKMSRRELLKTAGAAGLSLMAAGIVSPSVRSANLARVEDSIRIGVIHSLTGVLAITETPLKEAALMAIEEINQAGGVLGKKVEAIVEDGKSNFTEVHSDKVKKLLLKDKVVAVFGGWTSVSRHFLTPLFEQNNGLFFYPAAYEGNQSSKNVIYTGSVPNQQVLPAVEYLHKQMKRKKFYLVGSDYIFPRMANGLAAHYLKDQFKLEPVGEDYTPLGNLEYAKVVQRIVKAGPDVILSSILGESNLNFYKELATQGIKAANCPVVALTLDEEDLKSLPSETVLGHLAAKSYFQSVNTKANQDFVARFKQKYGKDRVTTADVEAAYLQVFLWKAAVEKAKSTDVAKVLGAIRGLEFEAPGGKVKVDEKNNHTWKKFRLGKINKDSQFDIVFESKDWIKPDPYPPPLKARG